MLNQIHRCKVCDKIYRPLYDMFDVELDNMFVERFGIDEYFQQAAKVFLNPAPINIHYSPVTNSKTVRFCDVIRMCPYCDTFDADDTSKYYVEFFRNFHEMNGRRANRY